MEPIKLLSFIGKSFDVKQFNQEVEIKLELKPVGKPEREVALLSWNKMFRMSIYQNDLLNILKNVCKESKL